MKILFITDNFPPEVNAPATRTYEHCRHWVTEGASVTVITCAPNFPEGKVFEGYKNRLYQREVVDGIDVIRVWSYITSNEGFSRRVLDYISFAVSSFLAGLFQKCDLIVATSPQFFTTLTGYGLSLLKRKPWVFELRDLWPESIIAVGAMKKGRAVRFLEKVEMFMYRKADLIVPVTEAFRRNLVDRGVNDKKITVISNGANLAEFRPRPKDAELVSELGLTGKFVFSYIGTHGMAHGLDFIVDNLAELNELDVMFLFVGAGACKKAVVELAREKNIRNAIFLDPVPKEHVARYLSISDAALVPLKKSDTFKTVIPSKIFEAAAMGKPVLLGVDGQARLIVDEFSAGIFFEPENGKSFIEGVERLVHDAELYGRLQDGCQRLAEKYDRSVLAKSMLEHLGKLERVDCDNL